jgi:hypothetical protein
VLFRGEQQRNTLGVTRLSVARESGTVEAFKEGPTMNTFGADTDEDVTDHGEENVEDKRRSRNERIAVAYREIEALWGDTMGWEQINSLATRIVDALDKTNEKADAEIERLREALRDAREDITGNFPNTAVATIDAALGEKREQRPIRCRT